MAVTDAPKSEAKDEAKAATKPPTATRPATQASTPVPAVGGAPYWVQVGAFKDAEAAKRLAARLRDDSFKVEESVKRVGGTKSSGAPTEASPSAGGATGGSEQYDVFVTGMSVDEVNKRLSGKGLSAATAGGGVVVKPSLPLRDAVALSKDLAVEGYKVQVRRAGSGPPTTWVPPSPKTPTPSSESGSELHRVRVGSFPDRAAAQAAARELEVKGYKPFIARGDQ
jgi:hypothetical protein